MLPLIAGIGSKLLSPGKTEDKNLTASKKKIKTEKFFDKKDKGGALVKTDSTKVKIKPSSALVKYKAPEAPKDKISDLSPSERKKSTGDELQSIIDEVKKLKSGLVKVRGLLAERKNSDLQSLVESRKALQIEKKKRREDELEKKKPKDEKSGISLPKPKFSFFDSIVNFFTSILIGSLLNFLLANKNTIFKAFDDISKGFNNIFDVMRYAIISLSTTMPKLIKSLASFGAKVFKGPAKLTGNLLKKLGGTIKNLLVRTGKALGNFVSGTFKNLAGLAGGAGSSATRATGVQQRRLSGAAKPRTGQQLRPLPRPGAPKPTSAATLKNAESLFKPGGLKHFKKVSGVFKKVPFIGALIGIGIDLAMGERLDNAIAGAAGASLGAAIGGAIGTAVLPIPFVGTFLGGTIGAAVGDWAGKEIYKNLSGQITQINPPPSEPSISTPGTGALGGQISQITTGSQVQVSGGNADFWTLAAIASLESGTPQGQADVAQSIYNRAAAGIFPGGKNIKNIITAQKQYSPVHESDPSKWAAIVDEATAIAAVASHRRGGVNAARMVSNAAQNINNPKLQQESKSFVGGRTDFNSLGVYKDDPANSISVVKRHGHRFGFWVGSGSISYGQSNPGPAGAPNLGVASTPTPTATSSTLSVRQSQLPALPPTGTYRGQHYGAHRKGGRKHAGVDFDISGNEKFYSRIGGVVTKVGYNPGGYGNYVDIYNADLGKTERIAEGKRVLVKKGDTISPGQAVVQGETETGVIHYEIRQGGGYGFSGTQDPTKFLASLDGSGGVRATQATAQAAQALRQQASYDQRGGTMVVPAPVIGGAGGQSMPGGGGGGVLPIGMLQKDVLNSYYRAQLMGFLYKQG
jgi:murein DD-endopeptidase MepM/ murein hydrolase activator NlpD